MTDDRVVETVDPGSAGRVGAPGEWAAEASAVAGLGGTVDNQSSFMPSDDHDKLLLEAFTRARRRFRGGIVALNDRTVITNAAASEILAPADLHKLTMWVQAARDMPAGSQVRFGLVNGLEVTISPYPVDARQEQHAGAVLHMSVCTSRPLGLVPADRSGTGSEHHERTSSTTSALDPALLTGWCDLTDSERTVAELVGRGLTNREAGRRLMVSRHTVDFHLRRVFRKLGIVSRIELARMLGEHYEAISDAMNENGAA